jgi:regulator of nucleoside diphosphate kinase
MPTKRTIYATENDVQRLQEVIREADTTDYRGSSYLRDLQTEIKRAVVVQSKAVPPDVVTMNSKIRVAEVETGEELLFTLVFPLDADIDADKISVLAPIGTAVLGYRVGDTFEWQAPDGVRQMQVKEIIYQPEASGDYHL